MKNTSATMTINCKDKTGIVAGVSNFLHKNGCNITSLDQYTTDPEGGKFFMRIAFEISEQTLEAEKFKDDFHQSTSHVFDMEWNIHFKEDRKRIAILCSKEEHALLDLLWSHQQGQIDADIPLVLSNHASVESSVKPFNAQFKHIANTKDIREEAEAEILEALMDHNIDCVVLARYMQILSPNFVSNYPQSIINIHHSFLPAFIGANPYKQALDKGVKLIGATAHYVSDALDEGPIIDQETKHISHSCSLQDLKILGQTIEKTVLTRAVKHHIEDRVILDGNKTIVFTR